MILVVYVFLQNPRSTLIPTICIFVALIATFAFLIVAGFTINLITLFALILVIGTVVDDAIIVVEAVQARFDMGYRSPYKAAVDGVEGVSAAVISATLVFMAVFIPSLEVLPVCSTSSSVLPWRQRWVSRLSTP